MNSAKAGLPNALALVLDSLGGEIPASMSGASITSTESCIAVGCRSDADGETEIVIGTAREVSPGVAPAFEGPLATPSRRIEVQTVGGSRLLALDVPGVETLVRIWTNDAREPDKVIIGIG